MLEKMKKFASNNIVFTKFLTILIASFIMSNLFLNMFIVKFIKFTILHTFLEAFCIFSCVFIFLMIWNNFNANKKSFYILGIGMLLVAFFYTLHSIYSINETHLYSMELGQRYDIASRIIFVMVFFIFTNKQKLENFNKYLWLMISVAFASFASFILALVPNYNFLYSSYNYLTIVNLISSYITCILLAYCFYKSKQINIFNSKQLINDLKVVILLNIFSEICISLIPIDYYRLTLTSHLIKITYHFILVKIIYKHTISMPYSRLKCEKEHFCNLLDSFPCALQVYDSFGNLDYANKQYEDYFECNRSDLYGITIEDNDRIFEFDGINTYKTVKGNHINLTRKIFQSGGKTFAFYHKIKNEQELTDIHIQTETILSSLRNTVIIIDTNKNVITCNKSAEEHLELSRDQIIGSNVLFLFKKYRFICENQSSLKFLRNVNQDHTFQVSLFLNNRIKELLLYYTPIKNIDDNIIGYIIVGTDITEIKQDNEKVMHHESLALLGQLGASIVHEARNRLTTIRGRSQIISSLTNDIKIKKHAKLLNEDVDEIDDIISEFLYLSKPRKPHFKEYSVNDIFSSIKDMITSSSLVKGIDVFMNISADNKHVLCDDGLIKQVILNLCKNAVEVISGKKDAKLIIESGYIENTNEIFIKVTDNGCGMPAELINKIGTPFFTTKDGGTGLGLATSYKIIKQHRGRIEVESKVGVGTTFTVYLPSTESNNVQLLKC